MLEFLRGEVVDVTADAAILEIGGVGLRVQMPTPDLADMKGTRTVYTVLQVREDDIQIFAFATERGRQLFRALTTVNGVGAKVALAVLSHYRPQALEGILAAGDAGALALVSGIGSKLASRIALELRDKVVAAPVQASSGPLALVREGLRGLGYGPQEIQAALEGLPTDGDVDTLLRIALRALDAGERV